MWVMVGWVLGDYAMWMARVPDRLRVESEARGTVTIPSFLGHGVRNGKRSPCSLVRSRWSGHLCCSSSTQAVRRCMLFDQDYSLGAILGAVIVVAYCFAGGIRASLWTDVAQSIVMFVAMVILCFVAIEESGGFDSMWTTLGQRPALTDWQPVNLPWGFTLRARLVCRRHWCCWTATHHGPCDGCEFRRQYAYGGAESLCLECIIRGGRHHGRACRPCLGGGRRPVVCRRQQSWRRC